MKIIRGGEVIYDSSLTDDLPPELIKGDMVESLGYDTVVPDDDFTEREGSIYDVVERKKLTDDQVKDAFESIGSCGVSFVVRE